MQKGCRKLRVGDPPRAGEVTEPIFVPWSAVSWVRPSVPEDLANPRTEAEQANPVNQIRPSVPEDRES